MICALCFKSHGGHCMGEEVSGRLCLAAVERLAMCLHPVHYWVFLARW